MREICRLIHADGSVEHIRMSAWSGCVYSDRHKGPLFNGFRFSCKADALTEIGTMYRNRFKIEFEHEHQSE